jgi:hypothetical protein
MAIMTHSNEKVENKNTKKKKLKEKRLHVHNVLSGSHNRKLIAR